ncbi:PCRF domain-containing protein [Actinomadura viridis]|uniref:Protein subunit release factor A n=1 Tax=Actinomadura viridis TaxID=58110 RepID=A0A931DJT5_9ACTN|nr:PCRF domain-containing protein [Actinomadura viridis]MBG6090742.1 protein subunit release factor A [Actinomadura viridis]
MDGAALAEVVAEYARLGEGLTDPRVLRDFRRARRVRRSLEALAPLHDRAVRLLALREDLAAARDLAAEDSGWAAEAERLAAACARAEAWLAADLAGRDRYDPYDVIVTIEGDPQDVRLLRMYCLARAGGRGWRTEPLDGEPGPAGRTVVAITAGEGGPGAWSVLKGENGVHRVGDRAARVTVRPDADESVVRPGADWDWRIDLACTRAPHPPPALRVTHLPTGTAFAGVAADAHRAHRNAWRQALAWSLAGEIGEGEPAHRFLHPGKEPVRVHRPGALHPA